MEDEKLIDRVKEKLLKKLDHWDQTAERKAAERADEAMATLLPQVMLRRDELAATVVEPGERAERYPVRAAEKIVDRLAGLDDMFKPTPAGEPDSLERQFAQEALETALCAAIDDPDYATLLTVEIAIELGAAQAETNASLSEIARRQAEDSKLLVLLMEREKAREAAEKRAPVEDNRILTLARKIVNKVNDPEEAANILENNIDIYLEMLAERERGSNLGDASDEAFERVMALIDAQDYAGALSQGEAEYRRLEEEERDQAQKMAARKERMVKTNLRAARLDVDAERMAHWIGIQAASEAGRVSPTAGQLQGAAEDWYSRSLTDGTIFEMSVSVALFSAGIDSGGTQVETANCEHGLGVAYQVLGERRCGVEGKAFLAHSEQKLRSALLIRERLNDRRGVANSLNSLGNTLRIQANRAAEHTALEKIDEAIIQFRRAAETFSMRSEDFDRALVSSSLGTAFSEKVKWLDKTERKGLLFEAVNALQQALKTQTMEAVPEDWALSQNNLATAYIQLAKQSSERRSLRYLKKAEVALIKSLKVRTKNLMPNKWAMTSHNLAIVYALQGEISSADEAVSMLKNAISIFQDLITVRTEFETPTHWAMTQQSMGAALMKLSALAPETRCEFLMEARKAFHSALRIYTSEEMPNDWNRSTNWLLRADAELEKHCSYLIRN